jgi:hypothetical protein
MPYATQRDRDPSILEVEQTPWPAPPLSLFLTSGYVPGVFDLVWTNPLDMRLNARFQILGVNLYRSFDSEFGPYDRVNEFPIGTTFWRDQTDNVMVLDEEVTEDRWIIQGYTSGSELDAPRYVFRTVHWPIIQAGSQKLPTANPDDVDVRIDGQPARIVRILGESGEIEIDPNAYPDVATQSKYPGTVPSTTSQVTVSYRYTRSFLRTDLSQRVFYRVTAVGYLVDANGGIDLNQLMETPLERAAFTSSYEIEKIDYIWREAVRRNRWILDQGGERVKVFIRKRVGMTCPCYSTTTHHQALGDCISCYGTGIIGGYEGPYDIVIAPDDSNRKIASQAMGGTVEHTYEVWTGPSPLLTQRDFFVKINGERYSVGAVRMPTNRGMVLQQHFDIGHLDEKDIRYKVPVDSLAHSLANQAQLLVPPLNSPAQITDKPNIPDERELRGRNIVWENITY